MWAVFRDKLKREVNGAASVSEQCFSTKGCILSQPIAFVVSSWTRILYTSDLLSDSSLKHGVAGAGSNWVDGKI